MWKVIGVFAILAIIIIANSMVKHGSFNFSSPVAKTPSITIDNHTFVVTLAKTQAQKEAGLSKKASLPQNSGMFFIFEKPDYYSFWMKDMEFPLDIIYTKDDQIVNIYANLKNPTKENETWQIVKPTEPIDGVLEINAGLSAKYGFKAGDKIKKENL